MENTTQPYHLHSIYVAPEYFISPSAWAIIKFGLKMIQVLSVRSLPVFTAHVFVFGYAFVFSWARRMVCCAALFKH